MPCSKRPTPLGAATWRSTSDRNQAQQRYQESHGGPQFRQWRQDNNFSFSVMAKALGVSVAAIQKLELNGINRTQALALAAIVAELEPIEFHEGAPAATTAAMIHEIQAKHDAWIREDDEA